MTSMKRRLLSLLMAMVMVCSLMPSALAADPPPPSDEDTPWVKDANKDLCQGEHGTITYTSTESTCTTKGSEVWKCSICDATKTKEKDLAEHTVKSGELSPGDYGKDNNNHWTKCQWCGEKVGEEEKHDYTTNHTCVCGKVDPEYLTGISLNKDELSLKVGATATLTVTRTPATGTEASLTWISDNRNVATVANGTVTAVAAGKATITVFATNNPDVNATCAVTVTDETDEYDLTITGESTVVVGKTVTLTADLKKNNTVISSEGVVWSSDKPSTAEVSETGVVTGVSAGTAKITAQYFVDDEEVAKGTFDIKVSRGTLTITGGKTTLTSYGDTMTLYAQFNGGELEPDATLEWTIDGYSTSSYVDLTERTYGSATITAKKNTPTGGVEIKATYKDEDGFKYTATKTIYVSFSTQNAATVTVYTSTSEYYLSESDDAGGSSIESQLDSYFSSKSSDYYGLESVVFGGKTSNYGDLTVTAGRKYYADGREPSGSNYYSLSEAYFTPVKSGSAVFSITANVYTSSKYANTEAVSCTITFKVEDGTAGGDVIFYGDVGEEVYLDSREFEDFWDEKFPSGTLDYVTFSGVSGGSLLDEDDKSAGTKKFYVSPGRSELALDEVHFKPSSTNSKKAVTLTFSFTAYGENKSKQDKSAPGTVTIVYMSASPKDISYTVNASGTVNLKASDFTAAYKEAVGSTAPTGLTIVLQDVPKNGTLTYTDSSKSNPSAVTLKSTTIKSRAFTVKSSGTNQIGDVTYTGKSGADTIEYVAYVNNAPKFKGKVVFNGTASVRQDIQVSFQSINGQPAAFSQDAFIKAESTLSSASKYRFALPANGSLYLNGSTSAAGIDLVPSLLGSVTYRPKTGFNGSDRIDFVAYDSKNVIVGSGTVVVTVAGNSSTATPGGVTNASQFTDVKSDAWYFTYLSDLVSKGIISGRGNGQFDPTGTVTYGEALKMVLEAAGYSAAVGTGNDWAINYKNLAVQNKWIDSSISLTAPISREATAELIAKVLGVSYSSSTSPFADTTNGYVVALYYTNPQILIGSIINGQRMFSTNDPLLRQEVCVIIYRMNAYHLAKNSNTMPDGI